MAAPIYATRDINRVLANSVNKNRNARIEGLAGQDSVAVGMRGDVRINIVGNAGDFLGALNDGLTLIVQGDCGRFLGDNMLGGRIIVHGYSGKGAGTYMAGGMIVVRGGTEGNAGQFMRKGALVIDGDAGPFVAAGMTGGDILITGQAGENLGQYMTGGTIFVNGDVESLGANAVRDSLSKDDKVKLTEYLTELNISGQFKFKKYVADLPTPFSDIAGGKLDRRAASTSENQLNQ